MTANWKCEPASGYEWERASGGLIRDGRGSGHSAETSWKTSQIIQLSTHPSQFEAALATLWYDSSCHRIHNPRRFYALDFSNSHPAKCKSSAGAISLLLATQQPWILGVLFAVCRPLFAHCFFSSPFTVVRCHLVKWIYWSNCVSSGPAAHSVTQQALLCIWLVHQKSFCLLSDITMAAVCAQNKSASCRRRRAHGIERSVRASLSRCDVHLSFQVSTTWWMGRRVFLSNSLLALQLILCTVAWHDGKFPGLFSLASASSFVRWVLMGGVRDSNVPQVVFWDQNRIQTEQLTHSATSCDGKRHTPQSLELKAYRSLLFPFGVKWQILLNFFLSRNACH